MNLVPSNDPVLRAVAVEVTSIAEQVSPYIEGMKEILRRHHGVGLAAPQVGISRRFFLYGKSNALAINPSILSLADSRDMEEGCLSFPGKRVVKRRAHKIDVSFLNERGELVTKTLTGLYAVIFQHELDHLNGICISPPAL